MHEREGCRTLHGIATGRTLKLLRTARTLGDNREASSSFPQEKEKRKK
jgi:hypothetical protein